MKIVSNSRTSPTGAVEVHGRTPPSIVFQSFAAGAARAGVALSRRNTTQLEKEMIMNREDLFPSDYFKASDLPPNGLPVKIEAVNREIVGKGAEAKEKGVVYFADQQKRLVLNATNFDLIGDALDSFDTDDWTGRAIVLVAEKTRFQGKVTPCVRVRRHHKPGVVAAKPAPTEIDPPPTDMDDEIPI
jgi:hypothetical protein